MKQYILTALTFILITCNIYAQNTGENELGSWYEITSSNRISNKFSISGSFTNWNYQLPAEKPQLYLGVVGLNYQVSKNVTVGIGYAKSDIDTSFEATDLPNINENRFLEQITFKQKFNNISWSQRFRLEQRFLEYPTEDILKHRIRYRIKAKLPLNKVLFISTYDEIHFNLNEFDFHQNRAYAALGANINKNINVELGYVRHSFKTKNFNRLSLQVNLKYDFRKEKN